MYVTHVLLIYLDGGQAFVLINADPYRVMVVAVVQHKTINISYSFISKKIIFPRHKGRSFKNNLLVETVGVPRGQSSSYYYCVHIV